MEKELTEIERKMINELDWKHNISVNEVKYGSGVFGVNWPGKGTKSISDTKKFIVLLNKAIKLADRINKRK